MNDVLNEAALQSAPQVLSTAALSNSSKATQSYASPISAMFWADQSGAPLAGTADYGSVVSLCAVSQVFGVSIDLAVFRRFRGGVIPIAKTSFVSNQVDQTFRLDVDSRANPNVYGGTLLEGTVTYSGAPPDFQDDSIHQVDTPALSMDIVPYVRTIMRVNGWTVGAACQDRWFSAPYAPGKTAADLVVQDILKMQWATGFSYIARVVENGFTTISSSDLAIAIRDKERGIKDRIKDQVRNGIVALPANDGDTVAFGTKVPDLETDKQGHNFPRFNRYFIYEFEYKLVEISLLGGVRVPSLDDFAAAVANCTFRFIALGQITKTGDSYKVSVTELGAYLLDSFDFNEKQQPLGYWNAKTNEVFLPYIGDISGSPGAATEVSNASYRAWRQRNARGTDYTNFSDILSREVSFAFPATQAELAP